MVTLEAGGPAATFTATPVPVGSLVPSVPAWSVSDVTLAGVVASSDGLSAQFTGILGGTVELTVSVTRSDGKVATGQLSVTIGPGEVQSFTIAQTA